MLPNPSHSQTQLAAGELLLEGFLGQEDASADLGDAALNQSDEGSAASAKKLGSPTLWAQDNVECIVKASVGELCTNLTTHNKDLIESMSWQLEEVKQAILRRLDGQDLQIGSAQEAPARVREHRPPGPERGGSAKDRPRPKCCVQEMPEVLGGQKALPSESAFDEEASDSNPVFDIVEPDPSGGVDLKHMVFKRAETFQTLEDADEHHRRASVAFSQSLRSASFGSHDAKKTATRLQKVVGGMAFETTSMVMILSNAVFVGIQTELAAAGSDEQESLAIFAINTAYTLFFSVELALRMLASGTEFFVDRSNWQWNWLDAFTVLIAVLECGMGLLIRMGGQSVQLPGVSQLRVLRVLRLVRLLRGLKIARVIKSIRALRTLVHQIMFTVKSMMWAVFLLLIIIYLFAVSFTQAANMHRIDMGWDGLNLEQHGDLRLHEHWSSLPRSMFTLFLSITGGVNWEEAVYPLGDVGIPWVVIFLLYICFAQMAVLNVITGYFCQSAVEGASFDPDLVAQKVLASKQMLLGRIKEIFNEIDADRSGFVTLDELEKHLEDDHTRAYFDSLGIDASDVWTLFKLMDADNGHQIDLKEFSTGCLRLSGGAKSLDLAKLAYDHNFLVKRLGKFIGRTDDALAHLVDARVCPAGSNPQGSAARP